MATEPAAASRLLRVGAFAPGVEDGLPAGAERVDVPDATDAMQQLARADFDLILVAAAEDVPTLIGAVRQRGLRTSVLWRPATVAGAPSPELLHALAPGPGSDPDLRLRRAIESGELRLHYQPQLSAQDGRIVGVEALVRWQHPVEGLLSPARFLPRAESSGSIVELGHWVLHAACADARRWLDQGREGITVAVNVSALQLQRPGLLQDVRAALDSHRLPPHTLALELSEAAAMGQVERMRDVSRGLRELGVDLVLDDFGVGASNLHSLRSLQVEGLKIDTSFVRGVDRDPGQAAIARAILELGHALDIRVVAEGVETEAELGFLRRNHCDRVQGYLFSPPVASDAVDPMLRQRQLRPEVFAATPTGEGLLLVDDEENVLRSLVRLFRRDGYRIHTATRVADAFEILAREPVQVILSDQRMPGTSGTEFLSQVKEMYPDTVRMVLSGYTDLASVTDAINRGAIYRFLTKPWDDAELRRQVQDAFRAARRAG
jgi:EAL domain-containing protein (putative c-di-GMP-specific phosphodiesterase class I)/CheY-like chemotaxis protein